MIAKSDIIGLQGPKMSKVCQTMPGKILFLELLPKKLIFLDYSILPSVVSQERVE